MVGGKYITLFPDDEKRELRAILYYLENFKIVKVNRENEKQGLYNYKWVLTKEGKKIAEKNKRLQKLEKEGDRLKFLKALKELIEKKEFFIP